MLRLHLLVVSVVMLSLAACAADPARTLRDNALTVQEAKPLDPLCISGHTQHTQPLLVGPASPELAAQEPDRGEHCTQRFPSARPSRQMTVDFTRRPGNDD